MNEANTTEVLAWCKYGSEQQIIFQPDLFLSWPGSAGMSFLMDLVDHLAIPDSETTLTHRIIPSDFDFSDHLLIVYDAPDLFESHDDDCPDLVESFGDTSFSLRDAVTGWSRK